MKKIIFCENYFDEASDMCEESGVGRKNIYWMGME
jgi:hypothetical protein